MFAAVPSIAGQVDTAFFVILAVCVVMLALITFLMIYFVIRYSRKRNTTPSQTEGNTLLEIIWTVIPTILVMGMFYYGWIGYKTMKTIPEDAMQVKVYGRMWSWMFRYENGVESGILRLPAGKPARFMILSTDVLHSFYVPAFRVKQDAVPGQENYAWFEPEDTGSYDIFCAEYCGERHSYMHSIVKVMPEADFNRWLDEEERLAKEEAAAMEAGSPEALRSRGKKLLKTKGCTVCHGLDGGRRIGPGFKGLFGRKTTVITGGSEREITADETYIRRSILDPGHDIVKTFKPLMPVQKNNINEDELSAIIEYLKTTGGDNE